MLLQERCQPVGSVGRDGLKAGNGNDGRGKCDGHDQKCERPEVAFTLARNVIPRHDARQGS